LENPGLSQSNRSFRESLSGPVDSATYDRGAGWRWVSWGPWGRTERFLKLAAYLLGTIAPVWLYFAGDWSFAGPHEATDTMRIAGWLMLLILTPLQVLDIQDRWLMRDYLSNLINIPRTLSHPLMGLMLLYGAPASRIQAPLALFATTLLVALFCEGVFLAKHLGREHRHPGKIPRRVFWIFLWAYVAIYLLVLLAGLGS